MNDMAGHRDSRRRILFVAWFLHENRHWLGEHLDPARCDCGYVGSRLRVDITSKRTGLRKWLVYFALAIKARWHLCWHRYDLVVTAFPQVGFALGLVNLLTFEKTPHVIWYFNCGHEYRGLRRLLSRIVFRRVERFIVYTRRERETYSCLFGVPQERFRFTYLTGAELERKDYLGARERYGLAPRYIASLGSSGRDYRALFEAAKGLSVQTVVVTHRYCLEGLSIPAHVKVIESIPQEDYLRIMAEAELVAIPIDNVHTASGQMTLIQAMSLGVPVVATRCIGTEDYIADRDTGCFVEIGDVAGLRRAIEGLLADEDVRRRMAARALAFAREHFFDRAGARVLEEVLDQMQNRCND